MILISSISLSIYSSSLFLPLFSSSFVLSFPFSLISFSNCSMKNSLIFFLLFTLNPLLYAPAQPHLVFSYNILDLSRIVGFLTVLIFIYVNSSTECDYGIHAFHILLSAGTSWIWTMAYASWTFDEEDQKMKWPRIFPFSGAYCLFA